MSKLYIKEIKENEVFESVFLVNQKALLLSKTKRNYLALKLADKTGEMEARVWDHAEELDKNFDQNDFVKVKARGLLYQDKIQLNVIDILKIEDENVHINDFLPVSKKNIDEMEKEFFLFIENEIKNEWIKKFFSEFFKDEKMKYMLKRAPAAKVNHHAWIGGLLEHVLQLLNLSKDVLKHYPKLSADLVYAGLILHDIGKLKELSYERNFSYTDEGQLVGHLIQGVEMIYDSIRNIEAFPEKIKTHLIHLVLAHHGKLEFGSPKLPMTAEAIMVHYLDDLDSKIQGLNDLAEREDKAGDWVSFNRLFMRPMYKNSAKDLV